MVKIAFVLVCLTCAGHGRRMQLPVTEKPAVYPAAFNPAAVGVGRKPNIKHPASRSQASVGVPSMASSRRSFFQRFAPLAHRKRASEPQMIFEKFTESAMKVVMLAQEEARNLGHGYVGDETMLLGVIAQQVGIGAKELSKQGATLQKAREVVLGMLGKGTSDQASEVPFSAEAKKVLEGCIEESKRFGMNAIDTTHILLALIKDEDGNAVEILKRMDVDHTKIREALVKANTESEDEKQLATVTSGRSRGAKGKQETLEKFSRDLTQMAAEGKLEPIVGRAEEIERVVQVLARRKKNNPVLIGDPGVGKTAIAEGLAQIISEDSPDLPWFLRGKRILSLDMPGMLAGTKFRGDFEERLQKVLKEVSESNREIILMIDELHMVVGAGKSDGGSMDAGNMLKPMLANGELQLIGATTIAEYRKFIEKDKALERRFQQVNVPEPTHDEAVQILQGLAFKYEEHHNLRYTPEAVEACVRLAGQYVADRYLPDKAIDLLDETGARVRLLRQQRFPDDENTKKMRADLKGIQEKIGQAVSDRDYRKADTLDKQRMSLEEDLAKLEQETTPSSNPNIFVAESDVERVVSEMTGIKVEKVSTDESARLMDLEKILHDRVIGQEEAVVAVAQAVRRARAGLKDPNRPLASFIFCGPTGVGKTELCKALTESYYGRKNSMLRFDMSEYMEKHTVSKLIGSPPGYVGYDEQSQLCDRIRRNPYSLVLFDEIEKAHPDVFNIMLQILEDGILTDSKGRTVSFKNALIIMTSNVGAQGIQKTIAGGGGFGFHAFDEDREQVGYEKLKSTVMEQLKNNFKPEFINRLDETIVFQPLKKSEIAQIADLEFKKVFDRVAEQGITIETTERFRKKVVDEGYDPTFGARPLRRAIGKMLEDELANSFLLNPIIEGEIAVIDLDLEGNVVILRGQDDSGDRDRTAASEDMAAGPGEPASSAAPFSAAPGSAPTYSSGSLSPSDEDLLKDFGLA